MGLDRNSQGSRQIIMDRLRKRGKKWTLAQGILGEFTPQGPWSEDLEDLIREGLVECQDGQPGPRSVIRESQPRPEGF